MNQAEFTQVDFAPPQVVLEGDPDRGFLFNSGIPLQAFPENLGQMLRHWAQLTPENTFLAERTPAGDWRQLSYAQTNQLADAIAQALLDRKLGPYRPVMILSGNSIDHALLTLGQSQPGRGRGGGQPRGTGGSPDDFV